MKVFVFFTLLLSLCSCVTSVEYSPLPEIKPLTKTPVQYEHIAIKTVAYVSLNDAVIRRKLSPLAKEVTISYLSHEQKSLFQLEDRRMMPALTFDSRKAPSLKVDVPTLVIEDLSMPPNSMAIVASVMTLTLYPVFDERRLDKSGDFRFILYRPGKKPIVDFYSFKTRESCWLLFLPWWPIDELLNLRKMSFEEYKNSLTWRFLLQKLNEGDKTL